MSRRTQSGIQGMHPAIQQPTPGIPVTPEAPDHRREPANQQTLTAAGKNAGYYTGGPFPLAGRLRWEDCPTLSVTGSIPIFQVRSPALVSDLMKNLDIQIRNMDSVESKTGHHDATKLPSRADRDVAILARMGKKQVLKRNFGFLSMLSFTCTILATWEGVLVLFATGFENGGPAGLVYQYILVWGGVFCSFVSIAELASMAPTAGGQYHWVSMLAPRSMRNFLSYITGWMTVLAWIAIIATGAFLTASMIQALCLINWEGYANHAHPYQVTLITWAFIIACLFFNTAIGGLLPKVEGAFLILHILGFFPPTAPVQASTMNYSSLVFGATVLYSIVYYFVWGKKQYNGPIVEISI
ncbi:Amino-acid permease BAT1-like protein [Cladobotryum mycophilum]|uniref:Amino-acid permease BAT1-like protein n=1 Tax=Cladobotryum mycophilum TaxID=491253 RepID=A0ABR0SN83_9HYPO